MSAAMRIVCPFTSSPLQVYVTCVALFKTAVARLALQMHSVMRMAGIGPQRAPRLQESSRLCALVR